MVVCRKQESRRGVCEEGQQFEGPNDQNTRRENYQENCSTGKDVKLVVSILMKIRSMRQKMGLREKIGSEIIWAGMGENQGKYLCS